MGMQGNQFYRQVVEYAQDSILVLALDGLILEANAAARKLYGYSADEFRELRITQLHSQEDSVNVPTLTQLAQQNGFLYCTRHVKKDGSTFPVEISSHRFDAEGMPLLVNIVRDIVDVVEAERGHRQREKELLQTHRQLNAAYEELETTHEELTGAYEELAASEEELRMHLEALSSKEIMIQSQNDLLKALQKTTLELMQQLDVDSLLEDVLRRATRLAGTKHGFVYKLDERKEVFRRISAVGLYKKDLGREIPIDQGIVGLVYKTAKPVIINDYAGFLPSSPASFPNHNLKAVLQIPLFLNGRLEGTIGLSYVESGRKFAEEELAILEQFASIASVALKHAQLMSSYQQEIKNKEAVLQAFHRVQNDNQAMINALPDHLFILNREGRFLDFRTQRQDLYAPPELFIGHTLQELFPPDIAVRAMKCIACIALPSDLQILEYELVMNGEKAYYEARFVACGTQKVMAMVRDVTEQVRLRQELEHLSLHDALTGIYNRAFFEEQLKHFDLLRDVTVGLLICDLDGLKLINDSLGHDAGDKLLQAVAHILQSVFRDGDVIARIGGDEFAVLLSFKAGNALPYHRDRLQQCIAAHNEAHQKLPISLSTGFARKRDGMDMRAVFKEADNNMYREKLHQQSSARSAIVRALMQALEARDFITEGHVDRLREMMQSFAVGLGLSKTEIADACLLAQFHDIGKVGIPDHVLFKPGSLTEEEWAIMRQHCEIGNRIARSAPDLSPIADWILKHHEWWNGKGYPLGLSGDDIPLPCRMLAIADAFDAMISDRPYRKALSASAALTEIERCAGSQFDPCLAGVFVQLYRKEI